MSTHSHGLTCSAADLIIGQRMASERMQRQIERLLDKAEAAVAAMIRIPLPFAAARGYCPPLHPCAHLQSRRRVESSKDACLFPARAHTPGAGTRNPETTDTVSSPMRLVQLSVHGYKGCPPRQGPLPLRHWP